MVMMMSVTRLEWRTGSIASRSTARPASTVTAIAAGTASTSGIVPPAESATAAMPPIITNSPCAKLMMSEVL